MHFWRDYPYIDASLRKAGFVEDPKKAKKVAEFTARVIKGVLIQIRAKNQRYKRQKISLPSPSKGNDSPSVPDIIEIDAGDDPAHYN